MAVRAGGLHVAQLLRPSGGLRLKSSGVLKVVESLSGDVWDQTGWKCLEAHQGPQLIPHWGGGLRGATLEELDKVKVVASFEGPSAAPQGREAHLGESRFGGDVSRWWWGWGP